MQTKVYRLYGHYHLCGRYNFFVGTKDETTFFEFREDTDKKSNVSLRIDIEFPKFTVITENTLSVNSSYKFKILKY